MNKKIVIAIAVLLSVGGGYWLFSQASKPIPGIAVKDQGRDHVGEDKWSVFKFNSNPPVSGPHDENWIKKGIYSTVQSKGMLIHSLEHGYVELHYNCRVSKGETEVSKVSNGVEGPDWSSQACKDLIKQLSDIVNEKTNWKLIVVPNPTIDTKISVVAWDRIDPMNTVKKGEIEDFIDTLRDHGPEQTMEP